METNTYLNVGLDFVDQHGVRTTNIQLVNRDTGKAIGLCDWHDEAVTRLLTIDSVDHQQFLKDATQLREQSIPVTFRQTKLP